MIHQLNHSVLIVATALLASCTANRTENTPSQYLEHSSFQSRLDASEFSLDKIDSICLTSKEGLLAVIRPINVSNTADITKASWEVIFLAEHDKLSLTCGDYAEVFADRLTGDRRVLMLNNDSQFLDIGWRSYDNTITVYNRDLLQDSPSGEGYFDWRYETSGGIACEGAAGFILKE